MKHSLTDISGPRDSRAELSYPKTASSLGQHDIVAKISGLKDIPRPGRWQVVISLKFQVKLQAY